MNIWHIYISDAAMRSNTKLSAHLRNEGSLCSPIIMLTLKKSIAMIPIACSLSTQGCISCGQEYLQANKVILQDGLASLAHYVCSKKCVGMVTNNRGVVMLHT